MSKNDINSTSSRDILSDFGKRIPRQVWICFITGIIAGLITHLYMFMNKYPNWDEINNLKGVGSGDSWGRWFLKYTRSLSGEWSVPAINGVLTVVIIAMASCFILLALDLRSTTSAILIPIMAVTFPGLTSIITFMFTSNSYAMGILMVCVGTYLIRRFRFGALGAAILFLCALGIYQSYICLAAGILVLGLLLDLLKQKELKHVIQKGVLYVVTLGVSMISYIPITKSLTTLTQKQGIDEMGQLDIIRIPRLIMRCFKRITEYFLIDPYSFVSREMHLLNIIICILIVILLVLVIWMKKVYKDKWRLLLTVIAFILIPLALASIFLLAPDTQDAAMTMLYQYFMIYVLAIALLEILIADKQELNNNSNLFKHLKQFIYKGFGPFVVGIILLVGYHNYLIANEAYFRMGMAYERVSAYYNRLMLSLEQQEEYQYGDKIAILGNAYPERYAAGGYDIDDDRFTEFSGVATENGLLTEGVRSNFLRIYLGLDFPELAWEEMMALKETSTYMEMPVYPKEGAIKKIEDIWVIKIYEEAEIVE